MVRQTFSPELTDKQTEAYYALNESMVRALLFGGAKGGAKSFFLCFWDYMWTKAIIARYGLEPTTKPPHIGFMGRKQSSDFTGSTLQTWQEIIPPSEYEIKSATDRYPKHILINHTAAIDYGGFDRQENINKFNSAEYIFISVDQAEEVTLDDVSILRASLRMKIKGQQPHYKELYTANPAQCWLKDEFILNPPPENRFVQALPGDNPYLPSDYIETLKKAFQHRPELLEAYLYGNWDLLEGAEQVIKSEWVRMALEKQPWEQQICKKVIACDPARFGDDETVIYYLEDGTIKDSVIYGQKDLMHTVGRLVTMAHEKGAGTIVVDSIGIGAGIVDRLSEIASSRENKLLATIIGSNSAEQSSQPERYYNKRAEIWDMVGRKFSDGQVVLMDNEMKKDTREVMRLQSELCVPQYKFKNGKMAIEAKEEIKKRIGHSPDRADAYVMGLFVMDEAPMVGIYHRTTTRAEDAKCSEYDVLNF